MGAEDGSTLLGKVPLFAAVPPRDLRELGDRLVLRTYSRGDVIFREGDEGDAVYLVDSGAVKVSSLSPDGREVVIAVLGPGEVLGELALLDSGARSADATAMEETRLMALSGSVFRPYLEQHPTLAVQLLEVLAGRLRETDRALQDVIFSDVPGRLAKRLLDLSERYGRPDDGGTLIDLPLTQEELGQMVGSARESVNKALASFISRGWLAVRDRRYVILEPELLRRRAG